MPDTEWNWQWSGLNDLDGRHARAGKEGHVVGVLTKHVFMNIEFSTSLQLENLSGRLFPAFGSNLEWKNPITNHGLPKILRYY